MLAAAVGAVGVPDNAGESANTTLLVLPVLVVNAENKFAEEGVARNVATLAPRPETPVEIGSPVAFVNVPEVGVPRAPLKTTNAPFEPVFIPSAVATPVPNPEIPVLTGNPVALVNVPDEGVPNAPPFTTNDPAVPTLTPSAVNTDVPKAAVVITVPVASGNVIVLIPVRVAGTNVNVCELVPPSRPFTIKASCVAAAIAVIPLAPSITAPFLTRNDLSNVAICYLLYALIPTRKNLTEIGVFPEIGVTFKLIIPLLLSDVTVNNGLFE